MTLNGCQTLPLGPSPISVTDARLESRGAVDHVIVKRLLPGEDVRASLEVWAKRNQVKAASVISAVGSVNHLSLRYAGEKDSTLTSGPYEIVSLSGLISESGGHIHVAAADRAGKTVGGHLATGSIVHTTLELVLAIYGGIEFVREPDARTGHNELFLNRK